MWVNDYANSCNGGAGFIGSAFVRRALAQPDLDVINIDSLTYAATPGALAVADGNPHYRFEKIDIANRDDVRRIIFDTCPDAVVHLAAETHVDRSIDGPAKFIQTNIIGTFNLLESTTEYFETLGNDAQEAFRFIHVSTDEVFGSLDANGHFDATSPYRPNSPYSASKASADHLVRAWHRTYNLPTIVTNTSNNYGPFQFPDKLIPVIIGKALDEQPIPLYGDGSNVRDWLYVDDHVAGLLNVLANGMPGDTYVFGGDAEKSNLEITKTICQMLDKMKPRAGTDDYQSLITFIKDRPGHDFRYALDASMTKKKLGWQPSHKFDAGLEMTVQWYLDNEDWREQMKVELYDGARLGLGR